MQYSEYPPSLVLKDYIKCYWLLDSNEQLVTTEDMILPCGCIDIILQRESVLSIRLPNGVGLTLPRFMIGPQSTSCYILSIKGKVKIFGIRLLPHAARSVLGFSPAELKSSIWPLKEVFRANYTNLAEDMVNMHCAEDAIGKIDSFFIEKISLFLPLDFMVKNVCNAVLAAKGDIKIHELFGRYKETAQTLRTHFTKQVGISPKDFISVSKFQYAASLLNRSRADNRPLTDIAISAGYYDQAHFIRTFKEITGLAPGQYCKSAHQISRFFTADESISFPLNITKH
jgi:AraC-like DNA-binding protein